jgi:circadian clock protein KaiC
MSEIGVTSRSFESFITEIAPGVIEPGHIVLIKGAPGSGKTTFAVMTAKYFASDHERTIYFSFNESRESMIRNYKGLGIDLEGMEKAGVFKYVSLPLTARLESIIEEIRKHSIEFLPRLIAVDPINPLIQKGKSVVEKRVLVQNYLLSIAKNIKSTIMLLVEEYPDESGTLTSLEYMADVVISLRYRIRRAGVIERIMETVKVRGSKHYMSRIPFSIKEGQGIVVYKPVIPAEIPPPDMEVMHFTPCSGLDSYVGPIYRGQVVYVGHPSNVRPRELALIPVGFLLLNNVRGSVISFRMSPMEIRDLIVNVLVDGGLDKWLAEFIAENYFEYHGVNPLATSLTELMSQIIDFVEHSSVDMVVVHGVEILDLLYPSMEIIAWMKNLMLALRQLKKTLIILGSTDFSKTRKLAELLSDLSLEFALNDEFELEMRAFKRAKKPRIFNEKEISECAREIVERILEYSESYAVFD